MPINLTGGEYSLSTSADLVTFTPPQGSGLSSTNLQEAVVEVNSDISSTINTSILNLIYPIGSIYMSVNNTNPGTYLTGTTWVAWGAGRVPVGVDANDTEFDTVEETGGSKTVTLTSAQSGVPSHAHTYTSPTVSSSGAITNGITGGNHTHTVANTFVQRTDVMVSAGSSYYYGNIGQTTTTSGTGAHTHNLPNHTHTLTGGGVANNTASDAAKAHNNLQPYITCYMWKRTA